VFSHTVAGENLLAADDQTKRGRLKRFAREMTSFGGDED
jgi:hypothetical protein